MASLTRVAKERRPQPDDDRRSEFEARVLRALEELMADGTPYTELAVQRIATASHMARSTFYRYFPDKSQLLIRMADLATADLFAAAENWWRADHAEARYTVVVAMTQMIGGFRRHSALLNALTEVSAYDRDVGRYWHERVRRFRTVVCERLAAEQRSGNIDGRFDVTGTAIVLTSMVERTISVACSGQSLVDDQVLAESLGRAIWLVVYGAG
ncbi:TetR/AcrR family transcriptional regulator [Nocardia sp. BMG111209]|uniref:TetR/AcrR family transcriptional regulator n=1 Tax=Nocardia sp. BMG111209 TaxID=1160137 RepID=UPI00039A2811|nr:TetR/AcrR family transcriptional regulator [Nocardia sp. BMG111209]